MTHYIKAENFDARRVSRITHDFSSHPALQFDELRELALRMKAQHPDLVKFIDPQAELTSEFVLATESYDGRSIEDIFDSLDVPGTWIAIYKAQTDPQFREVVQEVIRTASEHLNGADREIIDADAFIFISKAPTVTPFHIDRENNFLLQIHGNKRLSVWHPDDRKAVSEAAVEDWIYLRSLEKVTFSEDKIEHAAFDGNLAAGEGLFMPSTSAHMTRTETTVIDDPVSVTIGFVFYTAATRKDANIYAFNAIMRRLGITPSPPRSNSALDAIKYVLGYCASRVLALTGRVELPRGL